MTFRILSCRTAVFVAAFFFANQVFTQETEPRVNVGPEVALSDVTFEMSAFFPGTDLGLLEIPAGKYTVSAAGEDKIRLEGNALSFTVRGEFYEHESGLGNQQALLIPTDEDAIIMGVFGIDGAGVVALGSYKSVTTRGSTRLSISRYRTQISTALSRPVTYSSSISGSRVRPESFSKVLPAPTACSDVILDRFHASATSNYPNNTLALFTFTGLFTYPRVGVPSEVVVRIPEGAMIWSRVQFTFKTKLAGTERWQESLSILRPYAPALTKLTKDQATSLGYLRSPGRPCFVKAVTAHPQMNTPYMIGAGTFDHSSRGMELTFIDNDRAEKYNNNETIPWSGGAVTMAFVGFSESRRKSYDIEFWYFNDAGAFIKYAAFPIRMEGCGGPPMKHPSGSKLLTCNG